MSRAQRAPLLRLVAYDKGVTAAALALVAMLAWAWLIRDASGADHEMAAMPLAAADVWNPGYLLAGFAMWALMMVAMMLPSAAPMILLYGRIAGRYTAAFTAAYLALWLIFSAAAILLQAAAISTGLIGHATLAAGDGRVAGALLILAAAYQLTPVKRACLEACRSPLSFIMRLSRPGLGGALRLGAAHGLYCLGCCWALMLLLFVVGVMNLAGIGLIAAMVALEKLAPASFPVGKLLAALLLAAGLALLFS